jgi:hypothetical protein
VRGAILATRDLAAAEAEFCAALDLSRAKNSPTLTLLAALDLAKFLRAGGHVEEARAVLAPAADTLAPTPLLPAIAEAQALLAALM